jgi:hypothetical protein
MKVILILSIIFSANVFLSAQSDCSLYFPYTQGTELTYRSYDKKGNISQTEYQKVARFEGDDKEMNAVLDIVIKDKKGKEVIESSYEIKCKEGVLYFDVRSMFNEEMMAPLANMDFEVSGDELALPADLKVGQELKDGSVEIKSSSSGISILNMTVNVTNRKVTGREKVTTPAGTFDCFVISQDMNMKYIVNSSFSSVEYYAEDVGHVKSESYSKKGKLVGTRELVSMNNE